MSATSEVSISRWLADCIVNGCVHGQLLLTALEDLESLVTEPTYIFSREKGFLMLSGTQNVVLPRCASPFPKRDTRACFRRARRLGSLVG